MSKKIGSIEDAIVVTDLPYQIPDNWCWTRIECLNGYKSNTINPSQNENEIYELYSVPSFTDNYPEIIKGKQIGSTKQVVNEGDVLLCKINPRINRVWMVTKYTDNELLASSEWIVIRNNMINSKYLMWGMRTKFFRELMLSNLTGVGGSLTRAQPKFVKSYPFPLAPIKEQERIVSIIEKLFKKIDDAIEKMKNVYEVYEEKKSAILKMAFDGELTRNWRENNNVSIESWDNTTIGEICIINPKKIDTKMLDDYMEVSFVPMAAVSEIYGAVVDEITRPLGEVKKGFTNFKEGDVVFAKITPCMENGKSAIIPKLVNDIGYGTTEFFVLRCGEKIINQFLYHIVRDKVFREKAEAVMTGAVGQQRVPKEFLENYHIQLPSIDEQMVIVNIVNRTIYNELQVHEKLQELISYANTLKKSILDMAFRGELGTNNAEDESAIELLKKIITDN